MADRVDDRTHLAVLGLLINEVPHGCRLRVGGKVGRNLYVEGPGLPPGGVDVGRVDTAGLARFIVEAVNARMEQLEAAEAARRRG